MDMLRIRCILYTLCMFALYCPQFVHLATVQHQQFGLAGDMVTLSCHTASGAAVTWQRDGPIIAQDGVTWERDGQIIAQDGVTWSEGMGLYRANDGEGTLTIAELSEGTEGAYSCHTQGDADVQVFNVAIAAEPPWVELAVPEDPVTQGDFVELVCTTGPSSPLPEIHWTQILSDGSTLPYTPLVRDTPHANDTTTRSSSVTVLLSRAMYGSSFYCTVTVQQLHYLSKVKAQLDINVTPSEVSLSGFAAAYTTGDTGILSCVVKDAKPPGQITWYMDGNPVSAQPITARNPNGTYDVSSTLEIALTPAHDKAQFICVGSNSVMEQLGQLELRVSAPLSVRYDPEITLSDTPEIVWQRKPLSLVCQFSANPEPDRIVWIHNGVSVSPGDHVTVTNGNSSSTLHIASTVSSDKGEYLCEMTNDVGTSQSVRVTVTVLHAPVCATNQKLKYGVPIGGTAEVTCQMEANPNTFVFFQWQVNGTTYTVGTDEGDRRPEHVSSRYNYTVRTMEDYQPLECRATNGVQSPGQACQIYILPPGPALPPVDCGVAVLTSRGGMVTCREDYDGGSPAFYMLQLVGGSGPRGLARHNAPVFSLSGLAPATEHVLRVCASNTDYPETSLCTEHFSLVTLDGPDESEEPVMTSQVNGFALALGISMGFLVLFGVAGVVMVILKKRQDSRANKKYDDTPFPDPVSPETPHVDRVRVPVQQNPAYTRDPDDFQA